MYYCYHYHYYYYCHYYYCYYYHYYYYYYYYHYCYYCYYYYYYYCFLLCFCNGLGFMVTGTYGIILFVYFMPLLFFLSFFLSLLSLFLCSCGCLPSMAVVLFIYPSFSQVLGVASLFFRSLSRVSSFTSFFSFSTTSSSLSSSASLLYVYFVFLKVFSTYLCVIFMNSYACV